MRYIRWFLGKMILGFDAAMPARPVTRLQIEQAKLDQLTANMLLYQFEACPFCLKARRAIQRMNLKIGLKDAQDPAIADELIKGGGQLQVPCLRIQEKDGSIRWMYESGDIIEYLQKLVATHASNP